MFPLLLYVPPLLGVGQLDVKDVVGVTMVAGVRRRRLRLPRPPPAACGQLASSPLLGGLAMARRPRSSARWLSKCVDDRWLLVDLRGRWRRWALVAVRADARRRGDPAAGADDAAVQSAARRGRSPAGSGSRRASSAPAARSCWCRCSIVVVGVPHPGHDRQLAGDHRDDGDRRLRRQAGDRPGPVRPGPAGRPRRGARRPARRRRSSRRLSGAGTSSGCCSITIVARGGAGCGGTAASELGLVRAERVRYGFVIDQRRCIGCHACTVACKEENRVPLGAFRTWVKYVERGTLSRTPAATSRSCAAITATTRRA